MLRQFEREWPANGKTLWRAALDVMGIQLVTPQAQLDLIPKTGPVVLVANHPDRGAADRLQDLDAFGSDSDS